MKIDRIRKKFLNSNKIQNSSNDNKHERAHRDKNKNNNNLYVIVLIGKRPIANINYGQSTNTESHTSRNSQSQIISLKFYFRIVKE